jgi:hypothetical protein
MRHRPGGPFGDVFAAPSISVKLSALHPRYEHAKRARVLAELTPRVLELAQLAKSYGIGLTIDAEEADRLELSLDLIFQVHADPRCAAGTASASSCRPTRSARRGVIDWLADMAAQLGRRIPVRLVKGAYWDSRDQARPGRRPGRLPGVHPQAEHRRLLPRLRAPHARCTATRSTRSSPPTTRTPSPPSTMALRARPPLRVPEACTAWATTSTPR